MPLQFSFRYTNLDLEDPHPIGGPISDTVTMYNSPNISGTPTTTSYPFGPLTLFSQPNLPTPGNQYVDTTPFLSSNSRLANSLDISKLDDQNNPNPDPTQYPPTSLGSTNIQGHFPTTGKPAEQFVQKYTPENTYLDQINQ